MENQEKRILNGVMYALFHVHDLADVRANKYMYNIYQTFAEKLDKKQQLDMLESIKLALAQENLDDCCTLPDLPGSEEFKREYLTIVLMHLKNAMH